MEFRILGPLEVREGGRVVPLTGTRQRALLSILVLNANSVVPSARLIELLWGDRPPRTAAKALQVHVSELRKLLGKSRILTRAPGYLLAVEPGELDLDRFTGLTAESRELPPDDAVRQLQKALSLWRGQPLGEFAEERFAAGELLRLEEMHLEALELRIEAELALGRHAGVVSELEALVRENPLREQLRGQLMLALYRSGRQAEALTTYQDARRALVEELGLEPGRELQDLEQAVLRHDRALDAEPRIPTRPQPVEMPSRPPTAAVPERKLATVLFVDLVESTKLGEQDPERTRALLERYYEAVADEIEDAGGTLEKFAGDAVLATFGAPAGQEDQAERALHAALAVRSRCNDLFGGALALHIGVNTGEVVVGRARERSSFVTGDAVNVAARLEQIAEPGEILVGERTAASATGAFEFGPPTTVSAKGKTDGVRCRRLVRALAFARPRGVAGLQRVFVGRERELELLQATYRRAVEGREPHLVTIAGDAGVGKTRLVGALWQLLAGESPEPVRRVGRCLPYGRGVTYWPLAEVLKSHLGILEEDPEATVRAGLGEREILAVTLGLEPPSELHPLAVRERLHSAWVEFMEELVSDRPAVVLVEDLHWGEEPLLDLLDRVRREVAGPLLLVATTRPELLDRRPDWGAGGRNTTQLWLERLSAQDAEQMLEQLLETSVPEPLRRLVLNRSEGNPFFVEELLATFIDRGLLKREHGGWTMREPPADFAVPDSIQSVLAARIDLLDGRAKAALQAAAVVGRVFWAGPVGELTGIPNIDWRPLEDRDFVRRHHGSALAGEREFTFKHALTREVAYASLPKARRGRLHAAFAGWLERLGESRNEYAPLLAHHYAEAVRPEDADLAWAGEGEAQLEPLRAKARTWLRRAAELAGSRYAVEEQISLLRKAVELEPAAGEQVGLWEEIAHANALVYDDEGFREAMLNAIAACSDRAKRAELLGEGAFQSAVRWQLEADRELIEDWSGSALELAGAESRARAHALVARALCRPKEAQADARQAEMIARSLDDPELHSFALFVRADIALAAADYDEARRIVERRLETLSRVEDPDHRADALWAALPAYLGGGRFDEARRIARRHDEVTSGLTSHHRLHGVAVLLEVEQLAGDWERIRELTPRAEQAEEENTTRCLHNRLALLTCALASAYVGDDDEAQRLAKRSEASGVDHYGRTESLIWLALHRADLAAAERLLDELERPRNSLIRSRKFSPIAARFDALAALGRRETVERDAPQLLRPQTYLEPFALRALGLVREDPELIERAAASFDAMTLGWHAAQTRRLLSGIDPVTA
jgi:DNA-binding SARP family transcriptional activator